MCRVLDVSRSGYYAWARRPPSERTLANATLVEEIRRVHAESDGTYGSRRVHAELRREGHEVNHKRIERLMRVEGIQGAYVPPKRRGNADCALGVDGVKVWPDLVKRDFQPDGPNQLWCSDLKQIPTGEGVLHLASVLDCFSPPDRGLGDGGDRRRAAGRRRARDGRRAAPARRGNHSSLRSRLSGRIQAVVATLDREELRWASRSGGGRIGLGGR